MQRVDGRSTVITYARSLFLMLSVAENSALGSQSLREDIGTQEQSGRRVFGPPSQSYTYLLVSG